LIGGIAKSRSSFAFFCSSNLIIKVRKILKCPYYAPSYTQSTKMAKRSHPSYREEKTQLS
jgi:hypothetical protein